MKIFLSSTFQDLEVYRQAALRGLRQLGHEVIAMEDFTAASAPPLQRVLEKVREADAYVAVFAWRYGFVPAGKTALPPDLELPAEFVRGETSITHAEYLEAKHRGKPILAFLLDESVPWPPHLLDAFVLQADAGTTKRSGTSPGQRINELRAALQTERIVAFFSSPQDLEARVATAITILGMSIQVSTNLMPLTQPVKLLPDSDARGSLRDAIVEVRGRGYQSLTIDLDTEWWSTKLFLLAALAARFSDVQRIAVVEGLRFVGLLSLATISRGLLPTDPLLGRFTRSLTRKPHARDRLAELEETLTLWDATFAGSEPTRKLLVSIPNLRHWFGEAMLEQPVAIDDLGAANVVDLLRILDYPSAFVPVRVKSDTLTWLPKKKPAVNASLHWTDAPVVVIDKRALNDQLAEKYLAELMDRARLR
jgi:hypothetical protein